MSKRETKADQILSDARARVREAADLVAEAERELSDVQSKINYLYATLNAHTVNLGALEKALTPTPRKASTKKQVSAPAPLPEGKDRNKGLCAFVYQDQSACNCAEDNPIHEIEGGYTGYHPFEAPKPVARATRKSKRKSETTAIATSDDIVPEAISISASAGD